MALIGALIVAKVILVLEHVPLGSWVGKQPVYVDILLRTILYALGILVILIFEKAFDARQEYGGFETSLKQVFNHADIYHVWANTICIFGALLTFNLLSLIRIRLGKGVLFRMLLLPRPEE